MLVCLVRVALTGLGLVLAGQVINGEDQRGGEFRSNSRRPGRRRLRMSTISRCTRVFRTSSVTGADLNIKQVKEHLNCAVKPGGGKH